MLDTGAYVLGEMFQYCGRLRAKAIMVDHEDPAIVLRERDGVGDLIGASENTIPPSDRR